MPPVYCHVFRHGSLLATHAFEAPSVVKIGRLKTAHVVLDGDEVARQHCVLELGADGRGMVVDLGSEAGTMVDDRQTDRASLRPKSTIRIGSFALVVTPDARPPTAPQRRPTWLW
jgi:pSer/pThr/pTyr-binding forkhead associated (FHA) protein